MNRKSKRKNFTGRTSYDKRCNAAPSKETVDAISARNNNTNVTETPGNEPKVERANGVGPGDAGVSRKKLTKYRSNRSMDA
jgi:hypothetical protein